MGDYRIVIQGVGAHHNPDHPHDADRLAKELVLKLQQAGHSLSRAEFYSNMDEKRQDLL